MRNNVFAGLLLSVLSMFGTAIHNKAHTINKKDKAILRILHYRHMYMPAGIEKTKNDSFLTAITDDLQGSMAQRVENRHINGFKPNTTREAALRLAEKYITTN